MRPTRTAALATAVDGLMQDKAFIARIEEIYNDVLLTDRYLSYDPKNPGGAVDILAAALKLTLDSQIADSPVYQLLPGLEPADPNKVLVVPLDFREELH